MSVMNELRACFILLILPFFVFACSSTNEVTTPPPFRVVKTTLAKGINDKGTAGVPLNPTSTFSTQDSQVVCHVELQNLSGKHRLRWEWYDPNGNLYYATKNYPVETPKQKYVREATAWHKISLRGERAQKYPGDWKVNIYLDDVLTASDFFQIKETELVQKPREMLIPGIDFGDYYALLIGINDYQYLPVLRTPINDARAVGAILKEKYGFRVKVLSNPTRASILRALHEHRGLLTNRDNLLIYYAGHGWLDKDGDQGYWLPVDATRDDPVRWVSSTAITTEIRAMRAKHVMVVADSCYSGRLARVLHVKLKTPDYLDRMSRRRARVVLSSGGLEPVMDSGSKTSHSVFASAFIEALSQNNGVLDGTTLFARIREQVAWDADQIPEYGNIHKAGHDGGDFLFVCQQQR